MQDVIGGYKGLQGLTWGRGRYSRLDRLTRGYVVLQGVTVGCKWLLEVARGYTALQGTTGAYKGLRRGSKGLHWVTRGTVGCKRLQMFTSGYKW